MGTVIRNEISANSKYYISKHRYLELKHFCLQYPEWQKLYATIQKYPESNMLAICKTFNYNQEKFVETQAIKAAEISRCMNLVKKCAIEADKDLSDYIFKAVTQDLSYPYLSAKLEIPAGRDMYYDRYRKFFWLLDKER